MKYLGWILVGSMFITSIWAWPNLPRLVPTHWNIQGEIDAYSPKGFGAWFLPGLGLLMMVGFKYLPMIDPKKEKYKLFLPEWEKIQTGLVGFFAYIHGVSLYIAMNPKVEMMPYMFVGLGVLFILLGNYLGKIRQNYFVGIKVPWTLSSEENWNKTHRLASWWFVGAGILTFTNGIKLWAEPWMIFGVIMLAAFVPIGYSYYLFVVTLKLKKKVKTNEGADQKA